MDKAQGVEGHNASLCAATLYASTKLESFVKSQNSQLMRKDCCSREIDSRICPYIREWWIIDWQAFVYEHTVYVYVARFTFFHVLLLVLFFAKETKMKWNFLHATVGLAWAVEQP